jgi:hypothetical protein
MLNTENVVPHLREGAVNPAGVLLEGGVSTGIRRPAIHGRKNNDALETNPVTGEYAFSFTKSRKE